MQLIGLGIFIISFIVNVIIFTIIFSLALRKKVKLSAIARFVLINSVIVTSVVLLLQFARFGNLLLILLCSILGIIICSFVTIIFSKKENNIKPPAIANQQMQQRIHGKRCPACDSIYTDKSLNYCLSDGAILEHIDESDEVEVVVVRSK